MTWKKTDTFSLLYRQCPIILNFLNYKRKIWTATPLSTKPNTFILFHLIDKRACNYLKCDPTFVDEWHSEISTSYQQKKGKRWTDDLQTNGLDVIASCVGRITGGERKEVTSSWIRHHSHERTRGGDVGVKEKHNGKHSLHITVNGQSSIQKAKLMKNKKTKNGLIT